MAEHTQKPDRGEGQSANKAYETRDIKLRPLAGFTAGLAVAGIAVYLVVFGLIRLFSGQAAREDAQAAPSSLVQPAVAGEERLPPEPRIQASPAVDLRLLRSQEDVVLTTYAWVDRQAGVVRVPVEVAMALVLEEGLPVRQPGSAPPAAGTPASAATPQDRAKKVSK